MRLQTILNTVRSIRRFLDHDSPAPGRAVFAVKGRPSFAPQESLDALDPQGCTTAVDHRLEYLLHASSALKQHVAAIFCLIDRVLVVKFASLLLLQAQGEAEASSVNPTLTDLGQSPYHPRVGHGVSDLRQAGGVRDARKTIPLFLEVNLLPAGLAGDIFMTIQDHLRRKRRMPGDFKGDVPPLWIPDVERVVVDVGHRLLPLQVALAADLPNRGLSLGDQNQEQPRLPGMAGQIRFGDLVFPLASFAVDHGNVSGFGESSQTTAEAASQAHEVRVVQMLFRPVQLLPPSAVATARVAHAKVRVQHNAVHTIVRAFEKVSVVLAQCVWHPVTLPHPQRSRKNNGDGRRVSTSCVCCPARGPFFRAKSRKKPRNAYAA